MSKLELKKQEYSRAKKVRTGRLRKLPFCLDSNVSCIRDHLVEKRLDVSTCADVGLESADDLVLLARLRERGWVWVTRDVKRARDVWKGGLLYGRPGIVVIHSPGGNPEDLRAGIDAFLLMELDYVQMWERIIYLSHDKVEVWLPNGTRETLASNAPTPRAG